MRRNDLLAWMEMEPEYFGCAVSGLSDRECVVVDNRLRGKTFAEIGKALNVSRVYACKLEAMAHRKIRDYLRGVMNGR